MKLLSQLIGVSTIYFKQASADYNSIYKTLQTFEREMFMFAPQDDNILSDILLNMSNYGCWCNFNTNHHMISQAPAMDKFDDLCKTLYQGYSCGKIEGGKRNKRTGEVEECDPSTTKYDSGLNIEDLYMIGMFGDPIELMKDNCKANNRKNPCAYKACVVEGNFILKIFTIWNDNDYKVSVSDELKHSNGFDTDNRCRAPGSSVNNNGKRQITNSNSSKKSEKPEKDADLVADLLLHSKDNEHSIINSSETPDLHLNPEYFCCGEYPMIQPFRQTASNERACCGIKSYNALANMCCDTSDGLKVQPVCG